MVADKRAGIVTLPYVYAYKYRSHGEVEASDVEGRMNEEKGDMDMRTGVEKPGEAASVDGADGVGMHSVGMTEEEQLYVKLDGLAEGAARRLHHWGQRAQVSSTCMLAIFVGAAS